SALESSSWSVDSSCQGKPKTGTPTPSLSKIDTKQRNGGSTATANPTVLECSIGLAATQKFTVPRFRVSESRTLRQQSTQKASRLLGPRYEQYEPYYTAAEE